MLLSNTVPRGAYPERHEPRLGRFERLCVRATGILSRQVQVRRLRLQRFVREVTAHRRACDALGSTGHQGHGR